MAHIIAQVVYLCILFLGENAKVVNPYVEQAEVTS
jgi:hypothetical protein